LGGNLARTALGGDAPTVSYLRKEKRVKIRLEKTGLEDKRRKKNRFTSSGMRAGG